MKRNLTLMATRQSARARQTARMRLPHTWQMLGLHGQPVGKVDVCGVDLQTGRIMYLVLETPWQTLTIPWQAINVDNSQRRFQLRGRHRQDQPTTTQDPSP